MRYSERDRYRQRWARNLYAARLNRKLTQSQLARALGIDQQNISRWECGRTVPRDDMKILIAAFFEVAVTDLFPWEDPDSGENGEAA